MSTWSFLTPHARALLFIAQAPEARLREIAVALGVTERTAFGVLADLVDAGYVVKERQGRRNRYHIQEHLPVPDQIVGKLTIGQALGLLEEANATHPSSRTPPNPGPATPG